TLGSKRIGSCKDAARARSRACGSAVRRGICVDVRAAGTATMPAAMSALKTHVMRVRLSDTGRCLLWMHRPTNKIEARKNVSRTLRQTAAFDIESDVCHCRNRSRDYIRVPPFAPGC